MGASGNVVPFHGTPAPQSNCGLILSLANYPHIARAFGQATAQRLQHRLGAMLRQHFASSFIISTGPDGYFELRATDLAAASLHPGDIGSRDFLAALHSTIAASSIEVDGHRLRAVLAGTWSGFDDPAQVTSDNHPAPPSLRFSGEDVRNDAEWQARYRQDLLLADELFAGLHEDGIGRHDRWGCLVWQPVNLASSSSSVLFCDLAMVICTAQGELSSGSDNLDALGRLGLLDAAIRQLFLRALQELANYPDVVLCLSVPACAARPDGAVLAALTAGLAAKPQLACRLVIEAGGDSGGKAAELAGFCDRVRRLGCPISLGGFGGQGASARDLVALGPDYVRLDPFLVRHAMAPGNTCGPRMIEHLAGLAAAMGSTVIATGVDHGGMAAALARMGLVWQQGSYASAARLSRPWVISPLDFDCRSARQGEAASSGREGEAEDRLRERGRAGRGQGGCGEEGLV